MKRLIKTITNEDHPDEWKQLIDKMWDLGLWHGHVPLPALQKFKMEEFLYYAHYDEQTGLLTFEKYVMEPDETITPNPNNKAIDFNVSKYEFVQEHMKPSPVPKLEAKVVDPKDQLIDYDNDSMLKVLRHTYDKALEEINDWQEIKKARDKFHADYNARVEEIQEHNRRVNPIKGQVHVCGGGLSDEDRESMAGVLESLEHIASLKRELGKLEHELRTMRSAEKKMEALVTIMAKKREAFLPLLKEKENSSTRLKDKAEQDEARSHIALLDEIITEFNIRYPKNGMITTLSFKANKHAVDHVKP